MKASKIIIAIALVFVSFCVINIIRSSNVDTITVVDTNNNVTFETKCYQNQTVRVVENALLIDGVIAYRLQSNESVNF